MESFKERINAARAANGHPPLYVDRPQPNIGFVLLGKLIAHLLISAAISLVLWGCLGAISYSLDKEWLPYLAVFGGVVFVRVLLFLLKPKS